MTDYTVDEIMCTTLAAQFQDGDEVCNGMASFIPVAAIMLAQRTHAPGLVWLAGAAGVDPRPDRVPASTLEAPLWRDSVMYLEQYGDFWHYAQNGQEPRDLLRRRRPARHVREREQLGHRRRLPPSEGAPPRHGRPRRHGLARQAPLLLEPEPQPALARREGRLPLGRRLPRRRRRARASSG